jgi:hypothetical protein
MFSFIVIAEVIVVVEYLMIIVLHRDYIVQYVSHCIAIIMKISYHLNLIRLLPSVNQLSWLLQAGHVNARITMCIYYKY